MHYKVTMEVCFDNGRGQRAIIDSDDIDSLKMNHGESMLDNSLEMILSHLNKIERGENIRIKNLRNI